ARAGRRRGIRVGRGRAAGGRARGLAGCPGPLPRLGLTTLLGLPGLADLGLADPGPAGPLLEDLRQLVRLRLQAGDARRVLLLLPAQVGGLARLVLLEPLEVALRAVGGLARPRGRRELGLLGLLGLRRLRPERLEAVAGRDEVGARVAQVLQCTPLRLTG